MSTTTLPLFAAVPSGSLARSVRIFVTEARYEFLRGLRTRTYSLSVIGFPLMFYILFGLLMNRGEHIHGMAVARYLLGGYAVFGAVSAALFGVGVGLAAELNAGWLELKRASPMPPLAYLLAKCTMAMCFGLLIVCILTGVGMAFGSVTMEPLVFARMLGLTVVGTIPFASLALLLSLLVPANSAPGITNLINLPMSFLAGLWLPIEMLPKPIQAIAPGLPTYHLGQLMLTTLGFPSRGATMEHWIYLAGFTVVCLVAAGLVFRRIEGNA
ncbi:MAG TPA: ABC transporter permease [Acidobacteriaceae bacterium]|jgi:ABC-2 type transport system permease protein